MDIDAIKTASEPLDDGDWVGDDVHGLAGVRLRVRPLNSPHVVRAIGREMRKAPEDMRSPDGDLTQEAQDAIDDDILARFVLLDWDGLTAKKKPFPYSFEAAQELLKSGVFWSAAKAAAMHATRQSRDALEALAKN